jgi:hypothetical protein
MFRKSATVSLKYCSKIFEFTYNIRSDILRLTEPCIPGHIYKYVFVPIGMYVRYMTDFYWNSEPKREKYTKVGINIPN